jgi:cation transport regulator ChaB
VKHMTKSDLPKGITDVLPEEAQQIYLEVYQRVWEASDERDATQLSRQSVAHRQAWAAVGREYEQDAVTGQWHRKGEKPAKEAEKGGLLKKLKGLIGRS